MASLRRSARRSFVSRSGPADCLSLVLYLLSSRWCPRAIPYNCQVTGGHGPDTHHDINSYMHYSARGDQLLVSVRAYRSAA